MTSNQDFDRIIGARMAGSLLGRDDEGRLVVEARRPAADHFIVRVSHDVAASPAGQVVRATFDPDGDDPMTWAVPAPFAERIVEALAQHDDGAVLALVADHLRSNPNQKEHDNA